MPIDDQLLIPVWIISGTKRQQRRLGVLLEWEIRKSGTWWAPVAETRGVGSVREQRVSWLAAGSVQEIKG